MIMCNYHVRYLKKNIYIYIDKELPPWWFRWLRICIEGDLGLIPGLERSPGEGNGYPVHIFAWRIPWTEEPGGLQSMGLQRVRQGWVTNTFTVGGISLVAQTVKNLLAMWETWIWSWDQKDPLEKGMDTHSSILAWRIPWTEEPGRLQSLGLLRVGHNWGTNNTQRIVSKKEGQNMKLFCWCKVRVGYTKGCSGAGCFSPLPPP